MRDLAFSRGVLSGTHWAMTLLRPLSLTPRPRCPYPFWRPILRIVWYLGFSYGCHSTLHRR
jgi:hypothetical protein